MSQGRKWKGLGAMVGAMAFAGLVAPQTAQADEAFGTRITVTGGADYVTEYVFRGIYMENQGLIVQPHLGVSLDVFENAEHDINVSPYFKYWGSLHEAGSPSAAGNNVFQTDYVFGVVVGLPHGFEADVFYTFKTFPGGSVADFQEFAVQLSYGTTELLHQAGVPDYVSSEIYALAVWQTAGAKGAYLEIGAEVGLGMLQETDYPVDLTLGVSAGFSMKDYWAGTSEKWGFVAFDLGAKTSLESFIPVAYGSWYAHAGVKWYILNKDINPSGLIVPTDRKHGVVGTVGIGFEY